MRMRGLCLVEMVAVSIAFAACVAGNSTPRIFDERLVKMGVHVRARPPGLLGIVHAMRLRGGSKKALEMVTTDYKTSPRYIIRPTNACHFSVDSLPALPCDFAS